MGCPVGGGAKPPGGFVLGSSLDGLYSPPCWGPVFFVTCTDHWVGQAQNKIKKIMDFIIPVLRNSAPGLGIGLLARKADLLPAGT